MGKNYCNCWEVKDCGREPGGKKSKESGICPVFEAIEYDGVNDGQSAGRFCWVVAGTLCNGEVQGAFATKVMNCMACEFYGMVVREQGAKSVIVNPSQLK